MELACTMSSKEILGKLRVIIGCHLRNTTSYLLFLWLSNKSHPLRLPHQSAIVFSPHQDDETLGCGGMIALKRQLGVPVKVVFITDGRYGSPQPIESQQEFVNTRKQEAVAALKLLGVESSEISFLDQLDGSLATLSQEQSQNLIEQLSQLLQHFMPEEVYVPHCNDFHADHEATYSLVQAAIAKACIKVQLWQYPIWLLWQNPLSFQLKLKDISSAYRLSIHSVQNKKHQAIETYQSQIPGLTRGFLKRFLTPYEVFFKE